MNSCQHRKQIAQGTLTEQESDDVATDGEAAGCASAG